MSERNLSEVTVPDMYFSTDIPGIAGGGAGAPEQPALQVVPQGEAPQPNAETVKKLRNFSNRFCSVLGTGSMLKSATYYAYHITGLPTEEMISVSATSAAIPGEVTVTVSQVAEESRVKSAGRISAEGEAFSQADALEALPLAAPLQFDQTGCIAFSINGKVFSFERTARFADMAAEISEDVDAVCSMYYDAAEDAIVIVSDNGGRNSSIEIANLRGNAFGRGSAFGIDNGFYVNGQNTIAEINGFRVERESREYHHKGLLFTFNAPTPPEGVKFTVTRDYDSTVQAIQIFIGELCELISSLKEEEGEALASLADELGNALLTQEGGTGGTAKSFGILTENADGKTPLPILDVNKLKMNLMLNTEEIAALFSNNADGEDMGIAHKVKECIGKYLSGCRHPGDDGLSTAGEMDDRMEGLISDYRKRYTDMQAAALIMEHQREVISTLFDI